MPKPSKISVISYAEIGARVRALRLERGLTQVQLAKRLGTSQTALSEIERGNRGLTVQQVMKLVRAFKATPNEILGDGKQASSTRIQNPKIQSRLRRVEELPDEQQKAVLKLLDGIIEAHARG